MQESDAVSFEERFSQLVAVGDIELASQLLDIAKGNQVSPERYHYHRLQLLSLASDEDLFYEYYSEIENDMNNYPREVQTDISMLVVKMAQRNHEFG